MKSYKRQQYDPSPSAGEGDWFWGSNRGGGGAPLRTQTGEIVSNLRAVLHNNQGGDAGYDSSNHNKHREKDGYGRERRRSPSPSSDNSYDDRSSHNRRGRGYRRDDDEDDRDTRHGRNSKASRPEVTGLPMGKGGNDGSPRKFMSALQEMNSGGGNERNERLRKAKEYQDALAMQIAEKNHLKESEKKKIEEEKRRELAHYINEEYRGDVPAHIRGKLTPTKPSKSDRKQPRHYDEGSAYDSMRESDGDSDYDGRKRDKGQQSIHNLSKKSSAPRGQREYVDDSYDNGRPPKSKDKSKSNIEEYGSRNRRYDDDDSVTADYSDDGRDNYGKNRASEGGNRRNEGRSKAVNGSYDELSDLCKQLLEQQKLLQDEVKKQAQVIQELRANPAKGPRSAAAGARSNPTVASKQRSKSVEAPRRQPIAKANDGPPFVQKPSQFKAAAKNQQPVSNGGKKAPVKVAFGGSAAPTKPNLNANSNMKSNPSASNKDKRSNGGGGGFAALGAKALVKGGPVVVSYNDDDDNYTQDPPKRGKTNFRTKETGRGFSGYGQEDSTKSMELRGKSEYLRIGGGEVDVISGDQLDRLLVQAKAVRSKR